MKPRPISPGTDNLPLAVPNSTRIHLTLGPPKPLRGNGLHAIERTMSPQARDHLTRAQQAQEGKDAEYRTPITNSAMRGEPYTCPELRSKPYRKGSEDAYSIPSRTAFSKKGAA